MATTVTGLHPFAPLAGVASLVATQSSLLWKWDGSVVTSYTGATIDLNALTFMQQATDVIYGTDGINPVFKFDGSALSQPSIFAADGVTPMTGVADLLYYFDRMWYAIDDFIYYSDVGNPQSITNAPLLVRKGAGDKIVRLMSYRDQYLLVWKAGVSGIGSVHVFDVSTNTPADFAGTPTPLFDGLAIAAPHAIVRLASNSDADILYYTREGLRSLTFTDLDKFLGPSLPITDNIPTEIDSINYAQVGAVHATVFNDEILLWLPTGSNLSPDNCYGNSRKIPGNAPQEGWVKYDMMPATCSAICALPGDTKPNLYLGTDGGQIQRAFSVADTINTYLEIGKRIDFGNFDKDKFPIKFALDQQTGGAGSCTIDLLFEDDEDRPLGTQTFGAGGFSIPFDIPFDIKAGSITDDFRDIHFDANHVQMRRGKDFRVEIASTGQPQILGYMLQALMEEYRYVSLDQDTSAAIAATNVSEPQVLATNFAG